MEFWLKNGKHVPTVRVKMLWSNKKSLKSRKFQSIGHWLEKTVQKTPKL